MKNFCQILSRTGTLNIHSHCDAVNRVHVTQSDDPYFSGVGEVFCGVGLVTRSFFATEVESLGDDEIRPNQQIL